MIRSYILNDVGSWIVVVDAEDFPNVRRYSQALVYGGGIPSDDLHVQIGSIGPRGRVRLAPYLRVRADRALATVLLDRARRDLVRDGELRDAHAERQRADEARNGTFVVELDDGRVRRFSELRAHGSDLWRAQRPGAMDWANAELSSDRARHADVFRSQLDGTRSKIYTPRVLPARDGYPAMIVDTYEHSPLQSWSKTPGGFVTGMTPAVIRRAYDAKKYAMSLVDERMFYSGSLRGSSRPEPSGSGFARSLSSFSSPGEIADAWEVAHDAFAEAELPLQEDFAQENAEYWRARSTVSSRRAKPRKRTSRTRKMTGR